MIDMNQSIENIMEQCDRIAFNEFKGEAELAYAYRRSNETGTHSHDGGKLYYKNGKHNINSNNHNMSYELDRLKGKNKEETKRNYDRQAEYHKNAADTYHKSMDSYKDPVAHSIAKHNKKVNKESASIFDALFDQI